MLCYVMLSQELIMFINTRSNKCYNNYNFFINATNLIKNYLSNGSQIVSVNSSLSNSQLINRGVPQCSKLGPHLFLKYMKNLNFSQKCICMLMTLFLFALPKPIMIS